MVWNVGERQREREEREEREETIWTVVFHG